MKFDLNLLNYLFILSVHTHFNMGVACCEIHHRNGLIYITTYMDVKNNKMSFLTWAIVPLIFNNITIVWINWNRISMKKYERIVHWGPFEFRKIQRDGHSISSLTLNFPNFFLLCVFPTWRANKSRSRRMQHHQLQVKSFSQEHIS